MDQSYKKTLRNISTFIFDVDGVLTEGKVLVTTSGELLRTMSVRDGYALKKIATSDFNVCIISGGKNEGVRKRLTNLGITEIHLGIDDKVEVLKDYFESNDIKPENTAYMGDDIPDTFPMKMVGLPTCPQDAAPEVKIISTYISHCSGGQGAARDLIEQVLKIQNKW